MLANETMIALNSLEQELFSSHSSAFPSIPIEDRGNTKPYPERYDLLKTKLGARHNMVLVEALLRSLEEELTSLEKTPEEAYSSIILLNKHGKGHLESVFNHVEELKNCIINESDNLSSFELFILLCAIQIHDIGNMYGRKEHTTSFQADFYKCADESFITDGVLKNCIFSIARAHGGKINNNADTISEANLRHITTVLNKDVRQRFLAAILRFADELADDSSRSYDIHKMPAYSKLFHAYSNALHSVGIKKDQSDNSYYVSLCYYVSKTDALCSYKKFDKDNNGNMVSINIPLIREIIQRTLKMERERRYCSRHFLPYVVLNQIRVDIEIDLGGLSSTKRIEYTLRETGYPDDTIVIPEKVESSIKDLETM